MQSLNTSDMLIMPGNLGIRMPVLDQQTFRDSGNVSSRTEPRSASLEGNVKLTSVLTSLQRAVDETFVFGALTGPKRCGKSAVARALMSNNKIQKRICIGFETPNKVTAETISLCYKALQEALGLQQGSSHLLFVVDNAHVSSEAMMSMLNSIAGAHSIFSRAQVILVGEPELWQILALPQYTELLRRFALRCKIAS